jgi:crotonobetainyl-CoA:carnitine CoA-transferase CaiB-like acyl-CoA transferase
MFALKGSPWKIGREETIVPVSILNHITVIESATFVTGPYATALLVDLGARGIKIESSPLAGEHSRKILQELGYDSDAVSDLQSRGITKAP